MCVCQGKWFFLFFFLLLSLLLIETSNSEVWVEWQGAGRKCDEIRGVWIDMYVVWTVKTFRSILCSSYFSCCYKEILTLAHDFRGLVKDGREVRTEQLCRWWERVVKSSHMVEGTREQRDTGSGQGYHTPSTRPFFPVAYFPKLNSTCQNFQNPPKIKPLA